MRRGPPARDVHPCHGYRVPKKKRIKSLLEYTLEERGIHSDMASAQARGALRGRKNMKLKVVFDSTRTLADYWRWQLPEYFFFALFVAVALYAIYGQRILSVHYRVLLAVAVLLYGTVISYRSARSWTRFHKIFHYVGSYRVVQGTVQNYHLTVVSGSHIERFQVNGVSFAYANHGTPQCFHKTADDGGPIREGLQVRIGYAQIDRVFDPACIVRLEVP